MKNLMKSTCIAMLALTGAAFAQPAIDPALSAPIEAYGAAANAADLDGVMAVFTEDAVFMGPNAPAAEGQDAVRAAYAGLFEALDLDINFIFDEARQVSEDWAFVRTRSDGTVRLLQADNAEVPNANQEIFLLQRGDDGAWRIARYIFNTTAPAQ